MLFPVVDMVYRIRYLHAMDCMNTRPAHMTSRDPRLDRAFAVMWAQELARREIQRRNQNNPFAQLLQAARKYL